MNVVPLSIAELVIAALGVIVIAFLSWRQRIGLERGLLIAAARTAIQLLLVGLVLRVLFSNASLPAVGAIAIVMLLLAGREVRARPQKRIRGWPGYGIGTFSMFVSSFTVTIFALATIIGPDPWYMPQYAIPLLGMVLGNTMTGISVALDRLTQGAWEQREIIEQRLMLGESAGQAIDHVSRESVRAGLIPIMNSMAAAGIVSLPGMMTGQILSGTPPTEAVRYQILIMFLIATGTGLGTLFSIWLATRHLFDDRQRLRLDRLASTLGPTAPGR